MSSQARRMVGDSFSTLKLVVFSWVGTEQLAYIELTARKNDVPQIRVFGTNKRSVAVRASALPFVVTEKWGSKRAYFGISFGLNVLLNWGRGRRCYNYEKLLRDELHPGVPAGRIIRFYRYGSARRYEVVDKKVKAQRR